MKVALVMDMPENCASCRLCNMNLYDMSKSGVYCQFYKQENIPWETAKMEKPDWCPLLEVPEKKSITPLGAESYVSGWNDCVAMFSPQN